MLPFSTPAQMSTIPNATWHGLIDEWLAEQNFRKTLRLKFTNVKGLVPIKRLSSQNIVHLKEIAFLTSGKYMRNLAGKTGQKVKNSVLLTYLFQIL